MCIECISTCVYMCICTARSHYHTNTIVNSSVNMRSGVSVKGRDRVGGERTEATANLIYLLSCTRRA